jgi:hypothetical protein
VGNSRTRSQCSQRWQRGLDPRISRRPWAREEGTALARAVAICGEKAWIRVSQELGNRSDVQCRYRYSQIRKGIAPAVDGTPEAGEVHKEDEKVVAAQEIRPVERIGLDLGSASTWMLHQ